MKNIKSYTALAEKTLSKRRYTHSLNVADMAVKLADIYGADKDKAYIAGILHDIRKEADPAVLQSEAMHSELSPEPIELETPKLLHAIAGAFFVHNNLGIKDPDIIGAIRFHTVGAPGMTPLQKIIYLADLVSIERDYPEAEKYRAMAFRDLDIAFYEAIKWHLEDKLSRNLRITMYTLGAYNESALR